MNKFEKAYKLLYSNLGCSKDCQYCEENSSSQYLPGELEFLSKKFKVPKNKLATSYEFNGHTLWQIKPGVKGCCLFYKSGRCTKRNIRPLDCRSYPVIPYLEDEKISVKLDKKCPLVKQDKIKKYFIKQCLMAWQIVYPPKWWLEIYKNKP